MTERETFSVQRFFDQLILVYDNFQSMEIAAKKLNKMKERNKQPFSRFISDFEKKMLETREMDFNDQITKWKKGINSRSRGSFRISKKKMLETGGMDFNDQITKRIFNNVFNNEMHKAFIGFFIPAI